MLTLFRRGARRAAIVGVVALAASVALTLPASAHPRSGSSAPTGTSSLAALLAKVGSGFDHNWNDFDITDNAVTAVLAAKPDSAVGVLANGKVALTAFLPTDRAFRSLAHDLTGKWYATESQVFTALATTLGIDTIETVLLYHVVPGATVSYTQALRANGTALTTALGPTVTIKVKYFFFISLKDKDPNAANAYVVAPNLNQGNRQIAHGVSQVLRPLDLPPTA